MDDFWFGPWMWFIIALLLLIVEMVAPGVLFLWIAIAAGATGLLTLQLPFLGPEMQGAAFAVLAVLATWAGRRYFRTRPKDEEAALLNRGPRAYVGRRLVVTGEIVNGVGRVKAGDTVWTAHGDDAPQGAVVEVWDVDGIVLKVRSVDSEQG
ncbi:membrane protein [Iodidimonas muriae]|uniref:Membrane protein n=1 Tax=Iodidimonas muriae TaxID=261467 RepID=A0ABQ2LDR2_9PROT|nr:NfeD family protein [Iodidimonas muriae]GER07337.1 membrane protein [Kordiimonadales bacterium JCM 17843]GGO10920.1 membrane protein [Iodidimonas muriae]